METQDGIPDIQQGAPVGHTGNNKHVSLPWAGPSSLGASPGDRINLVEILSPHQVGACIVNSEKKIVGIGYNGMPNGCSDDKLPWSRTAENRLDTKYPYVCHAELNAILNKNSADVKGCTMYVALFPCNECAKLVIQSGIREIVFMSDKYHHTPEMTASRTLLDLAGVKYTQFVPKRQQITIAFDAINPTVTNPLASIASP
uniref:Deoxycytidylate deaminase n=1 Tax=Branchiostoma floridae TaxID=7739 RepID=C3YZ91_BRAFL|eukprot:XP_002598150.1 hypothetical protein BRAFLDRAFT_82934 [Branchiostoma floridae]